MRKNKKNKHINWITCIPLIGGSAIGCYKGLDNTKPLYHLSYKAFAPNETHLDDYWPELQKFIIDSEEFSLSDLPHINIDMVNSVCPCAGLSMLNRQAGADRKQNDWMLESTRFILEDIRPKVLWGENAPALATNMGAEVAEKLAAIGREYGYSFSMMKTNAKEHGLPQNRSRTFYFFWKSDVAPLIGYYRRPCPLLVDYLKQVPKDAPQQDILIRNDKPSNDIEFQYLMKLTGKSYQEIIKESKNSSVLIRTLKTVGGNFGNAALKLIDDNLNHVVGRDKEVKKLTKIYKKIKKKTADDMGFMDTSIGLAYTRTNAWVGQKPYNTCHPTEDRFFTIREHLHMMGMPHDFILKNPSKCMNHVCQNVPVATTEDFVKEVRRFIDKDASLIFAPGNYVVQNNKTKRLELCKMFWKTKKK